MFSCQFASIFNQDTFVLFFCKYGTNVLLRLSIKCNPKKYESGPNVLYLEFDNVVYFLKDYVRITFFECEDIGGNGSERCVVQEIYCNNNSAYTIL